MLMPLGRVKARISPRLRRRLLRQPVDSDSRLCPMARIVSNFGAVAQGGVREFRAQAAHARSRGREAERGLGSPWGCPPHPQTTNRGRRHRASAIGATVIAAGLEGCAFSPRRRRSPHPAPGGVEPSPTSRKRPSGDTKTWQASRRSTKRLRGVLEHSIATHGKSMKAFGPSSNTRSQHMGNRWKPSGDTRTNRLAGDGTRRTADKARAEGIIAKPTWRPISVPLKFNNCQSRSKEKRGRSADSWSMPRHARQWIGRAGRLHLDLQALHADWLAR